MATTNTFPAIRWRSEPFINATATNPDSIPTVPEAMCESNIGENDIFPSLYLPASTVNQRIRESDRLTIAAHPHRYSQKCRGNYQSDPQPRAAEERTRRNVHHRI